MLDKMEKETPEVGYLYLGGHVDWEYGWYTWTGPNYEAEWDAEDGWIGNGHRIIARTVSELQIEIDEFIKEFLK